MEHLGFQHGGRDDENFRPFRETNYVFTNFLISPFYSSSGSSNMDIPNVQAMREKMKHKLSVKQILLIFLAIFLCSFTLSNKVHSAISARGQGSDFNIYVPNGSAIRFQHLGSGYVEPFFINLTVTSGTLNGTNGKLTMWHDGGELRFTSLDSARINASKVVIFVNDAKFDELASFSSGDIVVLKWSWWKPYEPYVPIMFIIGMAGLFAMFIGPAYCIQQIKKRNYWEAAVHGFTITAIGVALFIAWLWG